MDRKPKNCSIPFCFSTTVHQPDLKATSQGSPAILNVTDSSVLKCLRLSANLLHRRVSGRLAAVVSDGERTSIRHYSLPSAATLSCLSLAGEKLFKAFGLKPELCHTGVWWNAHNKAVCSRWTHLCKTSQRPRRICADLSGTPCSDLERERWGELESKQR